MGCGLGQGYLVARPMTARGIEDLAAAEPDRGTGDGDEPDGYGATAREGSAGAPGADPALPAGPVSIS
jgi:hypothetical protein